MTTTLNGWVAAVMTQEWPAFVYVAAFIAVAVYLVHYANADPTKISANCADEESCFDCDNCSVAAMRGRRPYMEDTYSAVAEYAFDEDHVLSLYGVYDGHGGTFASNFAKQHCIKTIIEKLSAQSKATKPKSQKNDMRNLVSNAMTSAFLDVDKRILARDKRTGSTAVVATLIRSATSPNSMEIVVANVGDSRGVLCRRLALSQKVERVEEVNRREEGEDAETEEHDEASEVETIPLSFDHKPDREDERERVHKEGGFVVQTWGGIWRVEGILAVSRAFGDSMLKHKGVSAEPEMLAISLTPADEFFLLASDGLWDVFTSEDAVHFIRTRIRSILSTPTATTSTSSPLSSPCTHETTTTTTSAYTFTANNQTERADAILKSAVTELVRNAYDLGSTDNITAMVVLLKWPNEPIIASCPDVS